MAYSLGGFSIGYIQSDRITGNTGTLTIPAGVGTSADTESIKIINAKVGFNVVGKVTSNIPTFAAQLASWLNGNAATPQKLTYVSDLYGSFTVIIEEGEGDYVAGKPNEYEFSVRLTIVKP